MDFMIEYYTDGSASPNPGPGGFAVIKNGQPYLMGGEPSGAETTNIRMEGLAILAALSDADGASCEIKTDSEFWVNVLTKWAPTWQSSGWHKKGGIKNLDIVQPLFEMYKKSQAKLTWTRGHVGTELNELADNWANQARKQHVGTPTKVAEL
jgi:ribonuclease HI